MHRIDRNSNNTCKQMSPASTNILHHYIFMARFLYPLCASSENSKRAGLHYRGHWYQSTKEISFTKSLHKTFYLKIFQIENSWKKYELNLSELDSSMTDPIPRDKIQSNKLSCCHLLPVVKVLYRIPENESHDCEDGQNGNRDRHRNDHRVRTVTRVVCVTRWIRCVSG